MKTLFAMDIKNYARSDVPCRRPSARAIIRMEDGRLAMVYSRKYGYYKFPGGGIRDGEQPQQALVREVQEETGLLVWPESIQEYGSVLRCQKSARQKDVVFEQQNVYYFGSVQETAGIQNLDEYEKEAGFVLRLVRPEEAIAANKACHLQDVFDLVMIARETQVLERLCGLEPEPYDSMAQFLLEEASKSHPGPWVQHSRYAAESARRIASRCPGLEPERAYVYGLLHDIGRRYGISGLAHVYDGYHYLMDMGYKNAAGIALSHSFQIKRLSDYIGPADIPKQAQEEMKMLLEAQVQGDYDYLIQLCDSIAKADGIVTLEERMNDVKSRYGHYPREKWERNLWLRKYFEEKMQMDLYEAVRA